MKSVVLCADDYALNAAVTEAVVQLARAQRLSATSAMVLSPRWAQDAAPLRELREQLDVGLHLDWTSTFAQAAGHGRGLGYLMWRALSGGLSSDLVREVIERQLDAFEAHWQAAPDHVDGHQHVQQFAGLREVLQTVLQRRYGALPVRPWLRVSQVAQPGLKSRIISWMGAGALQQWAQQQAWPMAAPLSGVYAFDGTLADYAAHMQIWLKDLPAATTASALTASVRPILMCHPAVCAEADDEIGAARAREFAYLAGDDFSRHLQAAGVRLSRGPGRWLNP